MPNVHLTNGKVLNYIDEKTVEQNIEERGFRWDTATKNLERSDLTVHVYEGGFKVWECSIDLCEYISQHFSTLQNKQVLELGCGAALPGILSAQLGASKVVLQDFNECVIQCFTAGNVVINDLEENSCQMISGSWDDLPKKIESNSFDIILTSETIYNEEDYGALHDVICAALSDRGECLLAAKFFYFGVGGSIPGFIQYIQSKKQLSVEEVVSIESAVPRKILKLVKL